MTTIAVVIPYFQRKPGILRRALASIFAQTLHVGVKVEVIVVDDASPVPAHGEAEGLNPGSAFNMNIITQPNGGVGAARNTGLRHVPESATYIAFLDSDDIWQPSHLAVALAVLDQGFDYYFCDCKRVEDTRTYLSYTPFTRLLQTAHPLAAPEGAYALDKQDFHDTSIEQWMSLIPTVVYRRAVAPGLTFDPLLRVAGEDALFLLQVMEKSDRSACSTQCLVSLADGINIYASTYNWDDPANFIRYMGEIAMFNECRKHLRFSARSDATARARIRGLRKLFAFHTLRYVLKIRKSWPADLKETVSRDQSFWWWYPLYVLYVAIAYPIRLYNPVKG